MAREARKVHVLQVDGREITLERKAVKNINLRIRHDGSVYVSAPYGLPEREVVGFVCKKRAWIEQHARRVEERAQQASSVNDGATAYLWGEPLRIEVVEVAPRAREYAQHGGDALRLYLRPEHLGADERARARRERVLTDWRRGLLAEACPPLFARYEQALGVHALKVSYRSMRSRWGSCSVTTASIRINTELTRYPRACLESVVLHELCHLIVPCHNERFYALMDQQMPSWRGARAILKEPLPS